MTHKKKGPSADDTGRRGDFSHWHANSSSNNPTDSTPQESIRAELTGSTLCTGASVKGVTSSPVLAMCRKLIEAGHDPATPLHAYRGETLCLTVRSIGEGAALEINGAGTGFRRPSGLGSAPPVSLNDRAGAECLSRVGSSLGGAR
jgi:hypothetical protein